MGLINNKKSSKKDGIKPAMVVVLSHKEDTVKVYPLGSGNTSFGRAESSDIRVNSSIVGRKHGMFIWQEEYHSYYYADLNSTNGTILNGVLLKSNNPNQGVDAFKLNNLDVISVDSIKDNKSCSNAITMLFTNSFSLLDEWNTLDISWYNEVLIGRSSKNNIVLKDITVSRKHAIIKKQNGNWVIYDNNSSNGVFLNGEKVEDNTILQDNDVIKITDTILVYFNNRLLYNTTKKSGEDIHIDIIEKTVHKEGTIMESKKILSDIHLDIKNGEFVLILGGSGAGKTTLVNAILGVDKANGTIMLGNQDLYKNFETLKHKIGFVPQHSSSHLRMNDYTQNVIEDSARIKLPKDISNKELKNKVVEVMDTLGITQYRHQKISKLSGGQQKRVSVAVEAVSNPYLFILDEPDSGLDATTGRELMKNLNALSKTKKTVMVISHSSNNAQDLFTKVLVLAKSTQDNAGHLAFYGSVKDACNFFMVEHLQDIIKKINPKEEGGDGLADRYIDRFSKNRNNYI